MPLILIVDDDPQAQQRASKQLDSIADVSIKYAHNSAEALPLIEEEMPDVVLSHVGMPEQDGLQLIDALNETAPILPVILMTSEGNEKAAVSALLAGASSYVPKNELEDSLAETVVQVLEVSESKRRARQIMQRLTYGEARFELSNDLEMISPFVGFLQERLELWGVGDDSLQTQITMSLIEALTNAITHGNLELESELRRTAREKYDKLLEERQSSKPYMDRSVECRVCRTPQALTITIRDEGNGFDTTALPDPTDAENILEVSGRGLWLIRNFMDEVEFNDVGNEIRMTKKTKVPDSKET